MLAMQILEEFTYWQQRRESCDVLNMDGLYSFINNNETLTNSWKNENEKL